MTEEDYAKAVEAAAEEYGEQFTDHYNKIVSPMDFKAGIAWSRKNPAPHVMALVDALKKIMSDSSNYYIAANEYQMEFDPYGVAHEALAAFEKAIEK